MNWDHSVLIFHLNVSNDKSIKGEERGGSVVECLTQD